MRSLCLHYQIVRQEYGAIDHAKASPSVLHFAQSDQDREIKRTANE